MARMLGEAFFTVYPDSTGFRTLLDLQIRKAIAGIRPTVPIGVDAKNVLSTILDLQARMKALSGTLAKMRIDADGKPAEATIARLQTRLLALSKKVASITMNADTTKLDAQIAAEEAKLAKLRLQASDLVMDADTAKAAAKIAAIQKQIAGLNKSLDKLTADVDIDAAITKIYALEAELKVLQSNAKAVKLAADTAAFDAAINAKIALIATLKAQAADVKIGANVDVAGLAAADAALLGIRNAMQDINAIKPGPAFQVISGGGFANLGGQVAGIKVWHLALDTALESIIAVTGALIALGAGLAAISEPAANIGTRLKAVDTVSAALGVTIPPLTGKMDALMKAMVPQTIELFGAGLNIVQSQSGQLLKQMAPVVNLFDTWAAKIVMWVANQHSFGAAVQAGAGYLAQFGTAVGRLVDAISNLLSKDPGMAHYFLDIIQGFTGLLDIISKLPGPLLATALALHGVYLWTKVLVVAPVLALAKALGLLSDEQAAAAVSGLKFKNIIGTIIANPLIAALVALGAAMVYMGIASKQASNTTRDFITNLETGLSNMSASDAIVGISKDIGLLNQQIAKTTPAEEYSKGWNTLGQTFRSTGLDARAFGSDWAKTVTQFTSGNTLGALQSFGKALKDLFVPGGGSAIAASQDIAKMRAEIDKLSSSQSNLVQVMGHFASSGFTVEQSLALMDLAGVKFNDSVGLMISKVNNLITGYKNVTGTGGALENSVNAVTFAALQQQEKVQQLNDGWDAFFKTVSGGQSGFLSFAQQTIGLYASLNASGVKLTDSNGKVSASLQGLATGAGSAKISMTGLNSASITAQQTFLQSATAANAQMDNLNLLANAAGLGQHGVDLLAQANRDMVASLLPAAKNSQVLTDVLYALAQRGGYQGANSFKALSEWVGKVKDPMQNLEGVTATLTGKAAGLTQDVKNLSLALGTTLNNAMADVVFTFTGGKQALIDFGTALKTSTFNSKDQQTAAKNLADQFIKLTGNTRDAHNEFITFATQLGLNKTQAEQLWQEVEGKLSPSIQNLATTVLANAKGQFTTFAEVGLNQTKTQADQLWSEITSKLGPGLDNLGNLAGGTAKAKFIDWAENGLKLTQTQATALWNELVVLQNHINSLQGKTITLQMIASGQGGVSVTASGLAAKEIMLSKLAGGGLIQMGSGPTADDVPAMLSKGELVVPAKMVKGGAVDHLRGMLPGFAAGGLVSLPGEASALPEAVGSATSSDTATILSSDLTTVLAQMKQQIIAAEQAALIAAIGAKGITGAGVTNSSAYAALQAAAAKAGWTGAQWAALVQVENREAGFSLTAKNPSSGAYGLAQFINGPSEYATYGGNSTTAAGQAVAMVNYIKQRYGTPAAALAHENAYGWYGKGGLVAQSYDAGGYLRPGATLAWNGTGRPEPVGSPGAALDTKLDKLIALTASHVALTRKLIDTTASVPSGVGNAVGGAFGGASAAAGFRNRYARGGA
jgi:hypothetical protein